MIGYRHCDSRFPFLYSSTSQPAARFHAAEDAPAHYFADTPVGAWAEFLRHEGIADARDFIGVRRSLWAVELPQEGYAIPDLSSSVMKGGLDSYARCQAEASRLRGLGAQGLKAPSAALVATGARGWITDGQEKPAPQARDGVTFVLFGTRPDLVGWPAVEGGAPPERILSLVRQLTAH